VVAVVGENGAGKSTLVKLLLRLYEPTGGRITLNGIDIREYHAGDYRRIFAAVFQDALGFCLSARRNITLGDTSRAEDLEAVADAARRSGAEDFLKAMPKGYDSMLGRLTNDGVELSGGQWQRLAIARAFYRNAAFLILDEPTSALDPRAEGGLVGELRQVGRKKGVLVISHRLSTARTADHVLVLDGGMLVEQGAPDELLGRMGAFGRLFEVQTGQPDQVWA
jgi:ATP-binding cassette subfamily B protein